MKNPTIYTTYAIRWNGSIITRMSTHPMDEAPQNSAHKTQRWGRRVIHNDGFYNGRFNRSCMGPGRNDDIYRNGFYATDDAVNWVAYTEES